MKALCADVDKVETRGRWRPLQRAGSAGGVGVQPPHSPLQRPDCFQPACVGWMGRTSMKSPQKIYGGCAGSKGRPKGSPWR